MYEREKGRLSTLAAGFFRHGQGFPRAHATRWTATLFLDMRPKSGTLYSIENGMAAVDPSSLRRFVAAVPQLQRLLQTSGGCDRELLLQVAMRRTLRELSEMSRRAARVEADPLRAEQLRVMSQVASKLALTAPH